MVYVDDLRVIVSRNKKAALVGKKWGHQWCHLWADSKDELMAFAINIGMKKSWLQNSRRYPHFDLVPSMRKKAIENGAKEYSFKTWLKENRFKT
jgi:hypothetical protein